MHRQPSYSLDSGRAAVERLGAQFVLIECHVPAETAAPDQIRPLVATYLFTGLDLPVDSTRSLSVRIASIEHYIAANASIHHLIALA